MSLLLSAIFFFLIYASFCAVISLRQISKYLKSLIWSNLIGLLRFQIKSRAISITYFLYKYFFTFYLLFFKMHLLRFTASFILAPLLSSPTIIHLNVFMHLVGILSNITMRMSTAKEKMCSLTLNSALFILFGKMLILCLIFSIKYLL